ncbi:MAG: zinc ribbon domain-containing protein [Chloroflexota bacterium]
MKNTWKWILGAVLVLAALVGLPALFNSLFGYGVGGMMGGYGWHYPMMSGWGFSPLGGIFMGLGMLLIWIIPLGLLFLVVYGAIRLANPTRPPAVVQTCANCGKAAQSDWKTCPYCGKAL